MVKLTVITVGIWYKYLVCAQVPPCVVANSTRPLCMPCMCSWRRTRHARSRTSYKISASCKPLLNSCIVAGKSSTRLPTFNSRGCLNRDFATSVFPVDDAPWMINKGSHKASCLKIWSQVVTTGTSGNGWYNAGLLLMRLVMVSISTASCCTYCHALQSSILCSVPTHCPESSRCTAQTPGRLACIVSRSSQPTYPEPCT